MLHDRGTLDVKAFMAPDEWSKMLTEMGKTEREMRESYDVVIHMITAAIGARYQSPLFSPSILRPPSLPSWSYPFSFFSLCGNLSCSLMLVSTHNFDVVWHSVLYLTLLTSSSLSESPLLFFTGNTMNLGRDHEILSASTTRIKQQRRTGAVSRHTVATPYSRSSTTTRIFQPRFFPKNILAKNLLLLNLTKRRTKITG